VALDVAENPDRVVGVQSRESPAVEDVYAWDFDGRERFRHCVVKKRGPDGVFVFDGEDFLPYLLV
jgi:hypothetical protein